MPTRPIRPAPATPPLAHDTPGEATATEGVVLLDGPGNVAVAMTANAAEATGKDLQAAARDAREQASEAASHPTHRKEHDDGESP